jgi:hypothetical protein
MQERLSTRQAPLRSARARASRVPCGRRGAARCTRACLASGSLRSAAAHGSAWAEQRLETHGPLSRRPAAASRRPCWLVHRQDALAEFVVALDGGDVEAGVPRWSCPKQHARVMRCQSFEWCSVAGCGCFQETSVHRCHPFYTEDYWTKNSVRLLKLFTIYFTSIYNQKYCVLFTSIYGVRLLNLNCKFVTNHYNILPPSQKNTIIAFWWVKITLRLLKGQSRRPELNGNVISLHGHYCTVREWPHDLVCKVCGNNLETLGHSCKDCPFTKGV